MRVSVLQVWASQSPEEAMGRIERLAAEASGDILVLPEYAMMDPTDVSPERLYEAAGPLEGPWLEFLQRLARRKGSCMVGTLFHRSERPPRVYNSVVLIDRSGAVLGLYSKTHLFDALGYRESEKIEPGRQLPRPAELCGLRVGLAICFEIRYPELFRLQVERGVDAFIVPSAWYRGPGKEESYRFLAQARAHENVSFVVGAVLAGQRFTGRSLVVDPYGVMRAQAGWGEEVLEYTLDTGLLEEARRSLPLLALRRGDLYRLGPSGENKGKEGVYSWTGTIS